MSVAAGMSDTAGAIRAALKIGATNESADAVKRAVAGSIRRVDASVSVETTDYFNNSYAPDLVLRWDRAPRRSERFVFLRFNDDPAWIAEELPRLGGRHHPMIYGLSRTVENGASEELAERSRQSDTLVTDPAGVDQLAATAPSGIAGFLSRTLIRGGRGLVDEPRAVRATSALAEGFEAARSADVERTRIATETAEQFLQPAEASSVLRFLHAMWVASGALAEQFPADIGSASDPGDDGLRYLIAHDEEIADSNFWRALGTDLSLERLTKLGIHGSPPNLQHLISSNLDRLWARAFRVRSDQPRLDDDPRVLLWRLEMGLLALSGSNFTAYLGTAVGDIEQVKSETHPGVAVDEIRKRAHAVAVDSLVLTNGARIVTYGSSDQQTDVAGDEGLAALASALGAPVVERATFSVNGRHLELDFTSHTASARTSAQPPLTDILGIGLPLLWPLNPAEKTAFNAMVANARTQETLDLFAVPPESLPPEPV